MPHPDPYPHPPDTDRRWAPALDAAPNRDRPGRVLQRDRSGWPHTADLLRLRLTQARGDLTDRARVAGLGGALMTAGVLEYLGIEAPRRVREAIGHRLGPTSRGDQPAKGRSDGAAG